MQNKCQHLTMYVAYTKLIYCNFAKGSYPSKNTVFGEQCNCVFRFSVGVYVLYAFFTRACVCV